MAEVASVVRDALVAALKNQPSIRVDVASTRDELIASAGSTDVVVLGDNLRDRCEPGVVSEILTAGARVLVVSSTGLDDRGAQFLLAGATGFLLLTDLTDADLTSSVATIAAGRSALHPEVARAVLDYWRHQRDAPPSGPRSGAMAELSGREVEVLQGLHGGMTIRVMARRMGVAEKTVEAHRSKLYAKLGARNQAHALSIASERGLI